MDFYTVLGCAVGDSVMVKQSHSNVSSSKSFRLSSSCWSPRDSSRFNVSSRTIGLASTVTAFATVGTLYVTQPSSTYEGSIQLIGILPSPPSVPLSPDESDALSSPIVSTSLGQANIAPPDLINAIDDHQMIRNPDMATAVIHNLHQQGISLSEATLFKHLRAQTSPQGWLELKYTDTERERVERILAEVAQWYASQDSSCDIQACDDALFIESQLPILEQRRQDLEHEMSRVQATSQATSPTLTQQSFNTEQLDARLQTLLVQQHEQIQLMAHVETRMDELLAQLEQYQSQMHLSEVEPKTGMALLRQIMPEYEAWLREWSEGDRQLVTLTLARQIDGNLSTINIVRPSNRPLSHHVEHLLTRHNRLHDEMKQTVDRLVHQPLADMPMPIRELIVEDVARFQPMERWLLTLHRLQLLQSRRQMLEAIQQDTNTQVQAWQDTMAVRAQLQRELAIVNGTLSAYRDRYTVAQNQAAQAELTWQVVAPPEIVHQPKEWTWANVIPKSSRLVTLKEP